MLTLQDKLQDEFSDLGALYLRDYKIGLFDLCIRFGKTRTAIKVFEKLLKKKPNILICYPDNKIKESWEGDLTLMNYNANITLTNTTSLGKYENNKYDMFVLDEIHSLSENEINISKQIIRNSKHVLGLSGSISDQTRTDLIFNFNMKTIKKYSLEEGIRDGIIANYQITIHYVELDNITKKANAKGVLKSEKQLYSDYTHVINNKKGDKKFLYINRDRILKSSISKIRKVKELLKEKKRTLVFTGLTKTAESLGIGSYHSKSKDKTYFDKFQKGLTDSLALAETGKLGVTYSKLDRVILLSFTGNEETTSQIVFRSILLDYTSKVADIHIICSTEPAEIKKLNNTLAMVNKQKIKNL